MSSEEIKENDFVKFITEEGPMMLVISTTQYKASCVWVGKEGRHNAKIRKDYLIKKGEKGTKKEAGPVS